jgi:hypothetical protein
VSARRASLSAAAAGLVLAAGIAWAAEPPQVRVATTGNGSERVKTLPITRRAGAASRVVISMGPHRLPSLEAGDRLRVTAEFQVTGNCRARGPRCVGRIYHYDPNVRARLVIARHANTTDGAEALAIGPMKRETCTQRRPDYEHHCVLVFTAAGTTVHPARLPCPLDRCYVNLVADAHHPNAERGDLLMVGGLKPNGSIPQDRGRINVIRYRHAGPRDARRTSTEHRRKRRLRPDFKRRVVLSKRLDGLEAGEQLAVDARLTTDVSHLRYAVRTSTRLILADSPAATRQSEFAKKLAFGRGEISENNGSNCTRAEGRCTYRKVGVAEMRRDAVDGQGRPVPLYVNLVTVVGPKVRRAHARDRVIVRRGEIEILRFPAALSG